MDTFLNALQYFECYIYYYNKKNTVYTVSGRMDKLKYCSFFLEKYSGY